MADETLVRQNWQLYPKNVDEETIQKIINVACETETKQAATFNKTETDVSIRSSRVSWLNKHEWIRQNLFQYVNHANIHVFRLNVCDMAEVQYTEYHASENGHYDFHHDIDWQRNDGFDRKISVTVQLSDPSEYEGGDFVFTETSTPEPDQAKQKGSVLVFPSYLVHKVTPVTKGVRKSLVAWFEGPQWQ
jgi:PKHD-type hydroxylase